MYSTTISILKEHLALAEAERDDWRDQALIAQADLAKATVLLMRCLDRTQE